MEKGMTFEFYEHIRDVLEIPEPDTDSCSPLVLAYIGYCIYDLIIKSMVVGRGIKQVQRLHEETSSYVQASAQSQMMRTMQQHLTEEEHAIYRRGRNTRSVSAAKNQTITDYRRATGFEALLGYLFLKKRYARLMEIVKIGLDSLEKKE